MSARQTAEISGSDIVIRIPLAALAAAAPIAWDRHYGRHSLIVSNEDKFAREMLAALNAEDEIGETLLTRMLDRAAIKIVEDGGEGVADHSDFFINDCGVMAATSFWQRDDDATRMRLLLVDAEASAELIASWTDEQVQQADIWAWTSHLSAGDHDDIQVPERPAHIPPWRPREVRIVP